MNIDLVYIHVPKDNEHVDFAARFIATYHEYPPDFEHDTIIVCNGSSPTNFTDCLFASIPNRKYFLWTDEGWDIRAFQEVAQISKADFMVCFGGPAYFRRRGWLKRMAEAWLKHGPGMYGSMATYEVTPHINTSGFWCSPELIRSYPIKCVTKHERYQFEHGPNALWRMARSKGMPVMLVTWDGEWGPDQWRIPKNIYRRGDQSNCLSYFRHSDAYEMAGPAQKRHLEVTSDKWVVP